VDGCVTHASDDALARAFLLGELPPDEQERVEERLLKDGEFFEHIVGTEFDLADAYVRGRLPRADRERLEARLAASPALAERVEAARALAAARADDRHRAPARQAWRSALEWLGLSPEGWRWLVPMSTAAALLVVAALSTARGPAPGSPAASPAEPAARPPESASSATPSPPVLVIALGVARSPAATPALAVPPDAATVRVEVALEGTSASALAVTLLTSPQGEAIWSRGRLRAAVRDGAPVVSAEIPADLLQPGEYEVLVSEAAQVVSPMPLGSAFFRVAGR
jgi:hypothetical protein